MIGYRAAIHAAAFAARSAIANVRPHAVQPFTRMEFDAYVGRLPLGQHSPAATARIRLDWNERRAERLAVRDVGATDLRRIAVAQRRRELRAERRRAAALAGGWTNHSRVLAA